MNMEDLVLVEWVDSRAGGDGWELRSEIEDCPPVHCMTVGFVLDRGRNYVTLAPTVSDSQVLGRLTIPRRAIIRTTAISSSFCGRGVASKRNPRARGRS